MDEGESREKRDAHFINRALTGLHEPLISVLDHPPTFQTPPEVSLVQYRRACQWIKL